jgi:hypothetical protein
MSSSTVFTIARGKKEGLIVATKNGGADLWFSRYSDSEYEYRHVQLPKNMLKKIPQEYFDTSKGTLKLLWEEEWRGLGITQV